MDIIKLQMKVSPAWKYQKGWKSVTFKCLVQKTSERHLKFNRVRLPASIQSKTETKEKEKRRLLSDNLEIKPNEENSWENSLRPVLTAKL